MNGKDNPFHTWLTTCSERGEDFGQGYALFCKYSHNQNLKRYLSRRQDMCILRYQIGKLSDAWEAVSRTAVPPSAPPAEKPLAAAAASSAVVNRTYDERISRRSELPLELQMQYDRNAVDYHALRTLHEKMKQARSDGERKAFRTQCVDLAAGIRRRWEAIDAWLDGSRDAEEWNEKNVVTYIYKMSSARAVVSESQKNLLAKRYRQALDHGVVFKDAIRERVNNKIK